jgi:ABC-type nitrate/sulfonate/bicarbonate transport system substrate-binding protein
MRRVHLPLILALALSMAVAGCGGDDDGGGGSGGQAAPTPTIRLGQIPTAGQSTLFLLVDPPAGLTVQKGKAYNLEAQNFSGSPEIVNGLASGTLDAGAVGSLSILPAIEKGLDVKLTGTFFEERSTAGQGTWMVRKDSGIKTPADLKGKTIGTNSIGSPVYWLAKAWMKQGGLEEGKDYKFVAVPFAVMEESLSNKQVDAAVMIQPFTTRATNSGKYDVLFRTSDVQDPFVQTIVAVRSSFIKDNEAAVQAFVKDWEAAAKFGSDPANRDAVVQVTAKAVKVAPDSLASYLRTPTDYYYPSDGRVDATALQRNWDWFADLGGVGKKFDVKQHVDESLGR